MDAAFELGINFIDTANVYGRGAAESVLGEAWPGRPRDSYVLATKLMGAMCDTDKGLSRAQVSSRSTPRWSGCAPTTSTSTSATATTRIRRWKRPCRR